MNILLVSRLLDTAKGAAQALATAVALVVLSQAHACYAGPWIEFDPLPVITHDIDGAWVSAWVWVARQETR